MYWCRSASRFWAAVAAGILFVALLPGCQPGVKETGAALTYFDLKGYFKKNAAQFSLHNRPVFKTVVHNGITESKKIQIDNWERELSLFIGSDINKPAWKDSYQIKTTA